MEDKRTVGSRKHWVSGLGGGALALWGLRQPTHLIAWW